MFKGVRRSLAKILAIALASFLIVAVAMPSQSQTPQAETKEAIFKRIKDYARDDAKSGAKQPARVVIIFRENQVGLTSIDREKIDNDERDRGTENVFFRLLGWLGLNQRQEWLLKLLQILQIIAGIMMPVVVIVVNFKNQIRDILTKIRVLVTKRSFIGKYRQVLRGKKFSKINVPFAEDRSLEMQKAYVPLKVVGAKDTNQIDIDTAIKNYRKLMIIGEPGSGKSILLKNIAWRYGNGTLVDLPKKPIVILVELHKLNEKKDIKDGLVDALDLDFFPTESEELFVSEEIKHGRFMLLLDGLDEVNSNERDRVITSIQNFLDRSDENLCRVIITCRTAIYNHEDFREGVDKTLKVVEFNDRQMRDFLKPWESDMPEDKSIEQLMKSLHERPKIKIVARNPLILTIIACLYTDNNNNFILPHSRAEFYKQATDNLLQKWQNKHNVYEGRDKRYVLQRLALYFQENANRQQQDRRSVHYQQVLTQVENVLTVLHLNPEEHTRPLLKEIVERSGLFKKIDGGDRYQFAHLTLQEFFAAEALKENGEKLVDRFRTDPSAWRETAKLWCGLDVDSTMVIRSIGKQDPITAFECLADARTIEPRLAEKIINILKNWLMDDERNDRDQIVRAFAAIAADNRPKGQYAFQFLEETLADNNPARRSTAAKTLSLTNLPKAVQVLASHYPSSEVREEVREHLVEMGDLAVPALADLSAQGWPEAMDDLLKIGTPEAAEKLVPLLWNVNENLAASAAWRLAALLPQSHVEEVLRNYQITEEQKQAKWLDWIWKPFDEPIHSALPVIAGRIAYLLGKVSVRNVDLESLPPLDPRIIVPICSIEVIGEREKSVLNKFRKEISKWTEKQEHIVNKILNAPNALTRWQNLLRSLSPSIKVDLLHRLISCDRDLPTRDHWANIFQKLEYEFKTSSNYYGILWLAVSISVMAIAEIDYFILDTQLVLYKKIIWFSASLVIVSLLWAFFNSKQLDEEGEVVDPQNFSELYSFRLLISIMEFIEIFSSAVLYAIYLVLYPIADRYIPNEYANFSRSIQRIFQKDKWQNIIGTALLNMRTSFLTMSFFGFVYLGIHSTTNILIASVYETLYAMIISSIYALVILYELKSKLSIWKRSEKNNQVIFYLILAIIYPAQWICFVNIIKTWDWSGLEAIRIIWSPINMIPIIPIFISIGMMIPIIPIFLSIGMMITDIIKSDKVDCWLEDKELYGNREELEIIGNILSFMILSIPLLLCFPIVLSFASHRLWRLFSLLQFSGLWKLISISVLGTIIIWISRWLWSDGQKRDRKARNPLHGIIKSRSKL